MPGVGFVAPRSLVSWSLALLLLLPAAARASEPGGEAVPVEDPPSAPWLLVHFSLQGSFIIYENEVTKPDGETYGSRGAAPGAALDFSVGLAPVRGFYLGIGASYQSPFTQHFLVQGLSLDWYPIPGRGLVLGGLVGVSEAKGIHGTGKSEQDLGRGRGTWTTPPLPPCMPCPSRWDFHTPSDVRGLRAMLPFCLRFRYRPTWRAEGVAAP